MSFPEVLGSATKQLGVRQGDTLPQASSLHLATAKATYRMASSKRTTSAVFGRRFRKDRALPGRPADNVENEQLRKTRHRTLPEGSRGGRYNYQVVPDNAGRSEVGRCFT